MFKKSLLATLLLTLPLSISYANSGDDELEKIIRERITSLSENFSKLFEKKVVIDSSVDKYLDRMTTITIENAECMDICVYVINAF